MKINTNEPRVTVKHFKAIVLPFDVGDKIS